MDVDIPIPEVGKLTDDLKELTKNSVISVTVDDLNEGLIVVSYAHHDNLYQGVLLQLNRERGIPSGISFPKDYCTGSVVEAGGGENNDPTQVPPLTQRHTYFQDKDGTLLNDPVKSRLALRRVIKPPARFKNSRMSLRLRHRPVLCAKCRTLCEEKFASSQSSSSSSTTSTDKNNGSHTSNSKESNNSEDDSSKKQSNSNVAPVGVSTRRSKSAECGGTTSLVGTGTVEVRKESEEDYSFVTMGTKSCVENYWKRPSLIVEENSKDQQQQQQQQPKKTGSKDLILKVPRTSSRIAERNSVEETNKTGGSTTAAAAATDGPVVETKELNLVLPKFPTHKAGKSKKSSPKSIKLCISKISSSHCDIKSETVAEDPLISGPAASTILPDIRDENDAKMWENRIRKRSTVPLRFRDQGYVTKNIFNFKRRRDEGLEEEDEMPELTVRLSPDQGDPPTLEGGPSNPPKLSKSSSSEISEETTTTATTPPSSAAASIHSESSQVGSKSNASSSSSEPAKTPVIKICFGTPGNGVVIQIPPKAKQEDSSASSSSSSGDKAARKAMKKAKKEARRKLSLSREASPTRSISPAVAPTPASSSSSTSLQPLNCDELLDPPLPPPPSQLLPSASSVVTESDEPIVVPNKKRKKEKKKKREKELKENGGGGGLLLSTNGHSSNDSVEIQRISPLIVTEKQVPFKEDEDNELIPSCESKSIEKHDEDDPTPPEDHLPTTRLCISLKRLNNENSMGWDISHNNNPSHPHQNNNNNHHSHGNINELDELDQVGSSPAHLEPGDFPPTDESLPNDQSNASSIDSFNDERRNHVYKKGDIVWGKLPGCPWWPGKILDILFVAADDVTARVSWYRASTLSCIRFSQLSPFAEQFEARYTRSRKRGSYQHAVRDALIEAHQLDPNDLPSD